MQLGELRSLLDWVGNNDMAGQERDDIGDVLGEPEWWDDDAAVNTVADALTEEAGADLAAQLSSLAEYDNARREWLADLATLLRERAAGEEGAAAEGAAAEGAAAEGAAAEGDGSTPEFDEQWQMYRRFDPASQTWKYSTSANAPLNEWLTYNEAAAQRGS
jgi:hypothetical protein